MASVASQLIQEVTAHAQSGSLEESREICADGTYFLKNLRNIIHPSTTGLPSGTHIPKLQIPCIFPVVQAFPKKFVEAHFVTS